MTDDGSRSALGALILAIGRLRADADTAAEIAHMLRIDGATAVTAAAPAALRPPEPPPKSPDARPRLHASGSRSEPARAPARQVSVNSDDLRVVRRPGPTARPSITPPSLREPWPVRVEPLPIEPLLRPIAARAILGAAIATRGPGSVLDVDRAADRIARRRPLEPLPWRDETAMPSAVVILVDRGPGMAPFAQDAEDVVARIAAVAGRDRIQMTRVYQSPRLRPSGRAAELALPPRGTMVVALTDVGIAPVEERVPGLRDHWIALADDLRAAGCPLVAFVPYPPARWPRRLAAAMTMLPWDRMTHLATVTRILARARGRTWTR